MVSTTMAAVLVGGVPFNTWTSVGIGASTA